MDNLPNTWDEWIANFSEWQDRVGFNREWMGDFDLSVPVSYTHLTLPTILLV